MEADTFNLDDTLTILERTPATLNALLADLPERWLGATEGEGSWSPREVLVHLIEGERTNWLPRARHILAGETRPFDPFDRTGLFAESQGKSVAELLSRFAALRRDNVAALQALEITPATLNQTGQHPEFGEVRLAQLLATWVVHDLNHVAQIVRTMAKVYGEAVGPWSAYLAILQQVGE